MGSNKFCLFHFTRLIIPSQNLFWIMLFLYLMNNARARSVDSPGCVRFKLNYLDAAGRGLMTKR